MESRYEPFECKTIDGITIRCRFYTVDGPAPAIIMTHGFNCIKEMSLPIIAEMFQSRGYNVLLYDPRSIGASEGMPRNDIDPQKMSEDLSDIITHVSDKLTVDADNIFLWGMSVGGTVSALCAAIDTRPKGLIMVCPFFNAVPETKRLILCEYLISDRVSQLRGNAGLSLPPANSHGDNIGGLAGSGVEGGLEWYDVLQKSAEMGLEGFRASTTLQTYRKFALFWPKESIRELLKEVPVLMVVPDEDNVSSPVVQKEVFESLKVPKRLYLAKGAGHFTILNRRWSKETMSVMEEFMKDASKPEWRRKETSAVL